MSISGPPHQAPRATLRPLAKDLVVGVCQLPSRVVPQQLLLLVFCIFLTSFHMLLQRHAPSVAVSGGSKIPSSVTIAVVGSPPQLCLRTECCQMYTDFETWHGWC